jgi:hypothetical protein
MSSIDRFVRNLNSQLWHGMENIAFNQPKVARLLALPISIGTFIRDTLAIPAKCVEEIVLTVKSIKAYRAEENPQEFFSKRTDIARHSWHAIKYMSMVPFSPLLGIVEAIVALVFVGVCPLKTAKIWAAKQDFFSFLEEKDYRDKKLYDYTDELIVFANEVEFAKVAWDRFGGKVCKARSNNELKNLHFLDTKESKNEIINELNLKKSKLKEGLDRYAANYRKVVDQHRVKKDINNQITKLNAAWKQFQHRLIQASCKETNEMQFVFSL